MPEFEVGQIWERTAGPNKGRRVRLTLRLYDRMAMRSVDANRLSYVRTSVLRGKTWRIVDSPAPTETTPETKP